MAFSNLTTAQTTWWLANRAYHAAAGTPGSALVSDLLANDYLPGARAKIVSTGSTVSGVRTLTLERPGSGQFTVGWVATSSVIVIRP